MKMFLILVLVCFLIAWSIITLSDRGPDKPILITSKIKINGKKFAYVAFRANKKSPWRRIYYSYEDEAPCMKKLLDFALYGMDNFPLDVRRFEPDMTNEEFDLMYSTIKKEREKYK